MQKPIPNYIQDHLARMGVSDQQAIHDFLNPRLQNLKDPFQMKGMARATEIIKQALLENSSFVIWGDYDVDGTCGTALLVTFFRLLGADVHWYVPNRLTEGYGVNVNGFKQLHKEKISGNFVLITVDCGISNGEELARIAELGGEIIVTDHHQIPQRNLPDFVTLNPSQEDCGFHADHLAGVGVAFYLAAGVRSLLEEKGYFPDKNKPNLKQYLGYVALGSLADMVPLTKTNRILIKAGLEVLVSTPMAGLQALVRGVGITNTMLTSEDIGFAIGPRINAAGRLGEATASVELLTCVDKAKGNRLYKHLDNLNNARKDICARNLEYALTLLADNGQDQKHALVIQGDFHEGVMGIVASKLVEIYNKPTIVLGPVRGDNNRQLIKGSGRSTEGVHLFDILQLCEHCLVNYGGHEQAAGLSLEPVMLEQFREIFNEHVCDARPQQNLAKTSAQILQYSIDEVLNENNIIVYQQLEPFGQGNEQPVFLDVATEIISSRRIGSQKEHLQLLIRGKYRNYRGVGFGLAHHFEKLQEGSRHAITFTPMLNRYRGMTEWQVRALDIM